MQLLPWQRSTLNAVSFVELSAQFNLILVADNAVPVRLLGAFGTSGGVGVGDGDGVGEGVGDGDGVGEGVGVGVGVPLVPHNGNLNEAILVRQLNWEVDW